MIWEDSVYLVMVIGCLECHAPSEVVSTDDSVDWAKEAAERHLGRAITWFDDPHGEAAWAGEYAYAIYKLPAGDLVAVGR